jgi:dTDP-4-amino-4,6-dideoxygalactose transaminase
MKMPPNNQGLPRRHLYPSRPFLPPFEEYTNFLEEIWKSHTLTNDGQLTRRLEEELAKESGVDHLYLTSSGTSALDIAVQALGLKGEVITTPFTFPATVNVLVKNGITPVFADIDEQTLNIDTNDILTKITSKTTGILAVHCFGVPCDIENLKNISVENKLSLLFDAAHCFGVRCHCGSILNHGDISIVSLHATKCFSTAEGGLISANSSSLATKIKALRNFGYDGNGDVVEFGLNSKISELHSALGLANLRYINEEIAYRRSLHEAYVRELHYIETLRIHDTISAVESPNYTYFPIIVKDNAPIGRDKLVDILSSNGVVARKYFYPLITDLTAYIKRFSTNSFATPISRKISNSIICLPIHSGMDLEDIKYISDIIIRSLR